MVRDYNLPTHFFFHIEKYRGETFTNEDPNKATIPPPHFSNCENRVDET
jgi:hypothetical protein